jgi:hypothetical protein
MGSALEAKQSVKVCGDNLKSGQEGDTNPYDN